MGRCYIPFDYLDDPVNELEILTNYKKPWTLGEERLRKYAIKLLLKSDNFRRQAYKSLRIMPSFVRNIVLMLSNVYIKIGENLIKNNNYERRTKVKKIEMLLSINKSIEKQQYFSDLCKKRDLL